MFGCLAAAALILPFAGWEEKGHVPNVDVTMPGETPTPAP